MMDFPSDITSAECAYITTRIRGFFERHGAHLRSESDVCKIVDRVRWLGVQLALPRQPERSRGEKEELLRAFQTSIQARDIVYSLESLAEIPPEKLRHLGKQLDQTAPSEADTPGRDTYFELQIAGRLARSFSGTTRLLEPDVVMELPEPIGKIGFACKRPKTSGAIPRALVKAVAQGRKHGLPSVVVIGVDEIVQQQQLEFSEVESLHQLYRRRIVECAHSQVASVDTAQSDGAIAVIFGARYHGLVITDQSKVGFFWGEQYVGFKGIAVAEQPDLQSALVQIFG